jgi:hypothetical protein
MDAATLAERRAVTALLEDLPGPIRGIVVGDISADSPIEGVHRYTGRLIELHAIRRKIDVNLRQMTELCRELTYAASQCEPESQI